MIAPEPVSLSTPEHSHRRITETCLVILTVIAVGATLFFLRPVLVPFVLAAFISYALAPVIEYLMRRLRVPRFVAILGTAFLGLMLLAIIAMVVASAAAEMVENFPQYKTKVQTLTSRVTNAVPWDRLGMKPKENGRMIDIPTAAIAGFVAAALGSVTELVSNAALVGLFLIFLLIGRGKDSDIPPMLREIELSVRRYVGQQVALAAVTGIGTGAILALLGVDFAVVFGLLAFLLNFVPSIGSIISILLPLPVIWIDPEMGTSAKVLAIVLPATLQLTIDNVVAPRVQGNSLKLHPVVVILAMIFFGMLWGIVGAFLATPITAVLKIILDRIPPTRSAARLMGGDLAPLSDPSPGALLPNSATDKVHLSNVSA